MVARSLAMRRLKRDEPGPESDSGRCDQQPVALPATAALDLPLSGADSISAVRFLRLQTDRAPDSRLPLILDHRSPSSKAAHELRMPRRSTHAGAADWSDGLDSSASRIQVSRIRKFVQPKPHSPGFDAMAEASRRPAELSVRAASAGRSTHRASERPGPGVGSPESAVAARASRATRCLVTL